MNITKINVGGEEYYIQDTISGYTAFEWNPTITSGDVVGTMVFNGVTYTVYAPSQSMSNTLNIEVNGTDLTIMHGGDDTAAEFTEYVIVNNTSLYFEQGEDSTVDSLVQNLHNIFQFAEYRADDPDNDTIHKYKAKLTVDGVEYYGIFYAGYAPSGYYEASIVTSWPDSPSMLYLGNYNTVGNEGTWYLNAYNGDDSAHTISLSIYTPELRSAVIFDKTGTYDYGDSDRDLLTTVPMGSIRYIASSEFSGTIPDEYAYLCEYTIDGVSSYGEWYLVDYSNDGGSVLIAGDIRNVTGVPFGIEKDGVGWYIVINATDDTQHSFKVKLYY